MSVIGIHDKLEVLAIFIDICGTQKINLPENVKKDIKEFGFCLLCLGANMPGEKEIPEGGWCCMYWMAKFFPPLKICQSFKLNKQALEELISKRV